MLGCVSEPQSVELHIDGQTDKCSKGEDINFQFTGFGVVGRVCFQIASHFVILFAEKIISELLLFVSRVVR